METPLPLHQLAHLWTRRAAQDGGDPGGRLEVHPGGPADGAFFQLKKLGILIRMGFDGIYMRFI